MTDSAKDPGKKAGKKAGPKKAAKQHKRVSVTDKYRDIAAGAATSTFFAITRNRAAAIIDSPERLKHLAEDTAVKVADKNGPFAEVIGDLRAMVRLVGAYAKGDYRDIPFETLVLVVGAMIYVVSPLDLIPDMVPGAGYADDIAIVHSVVEKARGEITKFTDWEAAQPVR